MAKELCLVGKRGKGKLTVVDEEDYDLFKDCRVHLSDKGYARVSIVKDDKWTTRQLHDLIMKPPDGMIVDHINRDRLDNRRSNLRIVNDQQSSFNTSGYGNSSIYKGVYKDNNTGFWVAYITKDGKRTHIGYFDEELYASQAYNSKAIELFGEYAYLNDVPFNPDWEDFKRKKNKSSKYKYVSFDKFTNRWVVKIHVDKRSITVGRFDTEIEAVIAGNEYILANDLGKELNEL